MRQARELDRGPSRGALHGVPIGVKDIIDTADLPTEMGSEIYKGNRSFSDAACVAIVRAAGAVILGKTVTAEFAGMSPGPTTNPHNPAHTPGGSSSGSAAAVADHMVPAAFGTQTGGSVLRPAAYCGVVGYKPTFNLINRAGIKFAAETLDTIGLLAQYDRRRRADHRRAGRQGACANRTLERAPRLGLCRTPLWDTAAPETKQAIEDCGEAARRGRRFGARDHAAGGILAALSRVARDHQQLRALEVDGRRLGDPRRAHQQGAGRPHQARHGEQARGLRRGLAACRALPRR